ncbi:hypothetical protein HPB50_008473 [Hyalomma asiaticum]|uniref:Uncharacterized protein n=1 Tax=Hyalomma asiaticum TaxID=266040 RepID=A0ACB7TH53_HYAAI|nr:hypothetical protein HPB50_008473 [Hyalomma asiaticum]
MAKRLAFAEAHLGRLMTAEKNVVLADESTFCTQWSENEKVNRPDLIGCEDSPFRKQLTLESVMSHSEGAPGSQMRCLLEGEKALKAEHTLHYGLKTVPTTVTCSGLVFAGGAGPGRFFLIMASKPVQSSKVSILTPDYMELLQGLCLINKPSVKDVVAIFKEFRSSLDIRKPESSSTRSKSSPTSSSTPRTRGRKSAGRASAVGDKAGGDGCAIVPGDVGFERSCTWEPGQKPCWITSVLDLWNRVLARNCVELRQHTWDELTLQGYQWPENRPKLADMLPVSLLIHVLLRQHRCVTCIFLNMSMTFIERHVIWHALKTGAVGVKRLYYGQFFIDQRGLMQSVEKVTCSEAIASMTNLSRLSLSGIWFSREVVQIIGTYVEHATALSVLEFRAIEACEEDAGRFLDHLARNRSVKNLSVCETFLFARNGKALADVVQDHMCLEEIDVTGCPDRSPSPLLRAAVRSKTLRSLAVHQCRIEAQDIEVMAYALTRSPLATEIDAGTTPPPPVSPLRKLVFENCVECSLRLEAAYAKLIGGK